MDIKLVSVIFLFLLIPITSALDIELEIDEKVDGHLEWFNITSISPQKFSITWNNIGTTSCISRARIDFYNVSRRAYTSWGEKTIMKPGETVTWDLYSYLDTGQYNYTIIVYHCFDYYEFGPYPLVATNSTPIQDVVEIVNSRADDEGIELFVTSNKEVKDVVVIPESYPSGWVFEPGKIESIKPGEVKSVKLNYESIGWEGKSINFIVATGDGNYADERPIILRKYEPSYIEYVFILFLATILVIYLYFRKSRFLIWKR